MGDAADDLMHREDMAELDRMGFGDRLPPCPCDECAKERDMKPTPEGAER